GRASANFSLGRVAGSHQVFARVEDLPLVTFAVTATACPVARLNAVQGGGQSGVAGTPLGTPLAVRVTDSGGNAIIGAAISWSGTGSVSPSTTVSNSSGQATVQWTPANATGTQSMTASLGCSDAVFSASVRKRVATVDVSPSTPEVVDGGTISLSAVPRDEDGVPLG